MLTNSYDYPPHWGAIIFTHTKMSCIKYIILAICIVIAPITIAQELRTEIKIDFRVNSAAIDEGYRNNNNQLADLNSLIQTIKQDSTIQITHIFLRGTSSPEGSYQINRRLANERIASVEKIIRSKIDLPGNIISYNDNYIPWEYLAKQVAESNIANKQEVLNIIAMDAELVPYTNGTQIDHRILKLKQLREGVIWQQLNAIFFSAMRNAFVVFVTYKKQPAPQIITVPEPQPEPEPQPVAEPEPAVEIVPTHTPEPAPAIETWNRNLHIKTNALGWGLLISNVAIEIDLAKHLSLSLPFYYSAWDYFTSTIKFRTIAFQPEMRYWFNSSNRGLFAGAHFGMAYYNLAANGEFRYQDHNRHTPALGGGISVGYRMPLGKKERWHVEFAIGAGIYSLDYNVYENTPNTKQGLYHHSVKKTYYGIDQLSINFSRSFNLNKKGGMNE